MIVGVIGIDERTGVSFIAESHKMTPFEADVARKIADFLKTIKAPTGEESQFITFKDTLSEQFKNS